MTREDQINLATNSYVDVKNYIDFVAQAFTDGVKWADKHPKQESTDELLDKIPKVLDFSEGSQNIRGSFTLEYIHECKPYVGVEDWCAGYEIEREKESNHKFFIGSGDTPREALQQLYNWCVQNGLTESFGRG